MSYSLDLRKRAIAAYESGELTQKTIAERLQINLSTLKRWLTRHRKGESLMPRKGNKGRPSKIDHAGLETLKKAVMANPSITLAELSTLYFKKHKVVVGRSILSRALQALNLRYKKLSIKPLAQDGDKVKKKD